jgi:hypothetical protein
VAPVPPGERGQEDRFFAAALFRQPAAFKDEPIERRLRRVGEAHDLADRRLRVSRQGQVDRLDHPGIHQGDARNRLQPAGHALGGALQRHEGVGEPVALVVGPLRVLQRFPRALKGDEAGDSAGDHQRHGQDLALQLHQVAEQLAIERLHHRRLSTEAFASGLVSWTMRPSARVTTRSAIAAMGMLCVMMAVVVPISRLTRASASNTIFPV